MQGPADVYARVCVFIRTYSYVRVYTRQAPLTVRAHTVIDINNINARFSSLCQRATGRAYRVALLSILFCYCLGEMYSVPVKLLEHIFSRILCA